MRPPLWEVIEATKQVLYALEEAESAECCNDKPEADKLRQEAEKNFRQLSALMEKV